ncbi:MAG: glycosyltransferase [Candidatus Komeilibacteria bacterium]|jgi:teichuronic acid biosynthesis glycosyltransferase TuaH|nr:glycosyltransferase [Candidatus Komeilibacteria bacterium]MBT4447641.1 glycosyltransferase [Candidatus Komeilibacteria bacterium]
MKKFDVIMLNMSNYSEWDEGVSNRNYHILRELLNREEVGKVLAVDYLPLNFKRALRTYKEDLVLNIDKSKIVKRGLTHKVSKISEKLYVYTDIDFWLRPKSSMNRIKKTAIDLGFDDFVLWSYYPFAAPHWDNMGQKMTIFDAVDNWLLHSSYEKYTDRLKANYEKIKDETDLIFVVSKNLTNFFDDQPNVYWVPNGVDIKHYNKKFALMNRDISDIAKPIIGYVGVVQKKVDFELLKYLADKNPDKSIVIVGPVWAEQEKAKEVLAQQKNVYFLGYKKYNEAPQYIQQFDVGIIPHKTAGFSATTNPMKMYEYLACGKPVVATDNIGTENVEDMISVAKDYESFNQAVNNALENDKPEAITKRREFVKKFSWFNTVSKMIDLVNNKFN